MTVALYRCFLRLLKLPLPVSYQSGLLSSSALWEDFSASPGITAGQTADTKCIPEGANCSKTRNNDSFVLLQPVAESRTSPTKSLQNGSPSKCPRFLKIKNWETGAIQNDTLHNSSTKVRCMEMCFINSCKKLKDPAGREERMMERMEIWGFQRWMWMITVSCKHAHIFRVTRLLFCSWWHIFPALGQCFKGPDVHVFQPAGWLEASKVCTLNNASFASQVDWRIIAHRSMSPLYFTPCHLCISGITNFWRLSSLQSQGNWGVGC